MSFRDKPWTALKTRPGGCPAVELPGAIEALTRSDSERWEDVDGLRSLYGSGQIFSAAGKAVPLLVNLLGNESVPNKDIVLCFVIACVCNVSPKQLVWGHDMRHAETKKFYSRGVAKEVRASAWEGRDIYLQLLTSSEPFNRSAAAYMLAFDYDQADSSHAAVERALLEEREEFAKGSMILSLGLLRSYKTQTRKQTDFSQLVKDRKQPILIRGLAALAAIYEGHSGVVLTPESREVLGALVQLAEVDCDGFLWNNGVLDMLISRVVEGRCKNGPREAARLLAGVLGENKTHARADDWVSGILELAFEPSNSFRSAGPFAISGDAHDPAAFDDDQLELLKPLSAYSYRAPFLAYGIPQEVRDRRRWLGLEPPGPMEQIVTMKVGDALKEWPVWKCLTANPVPPPEMPHHVERVLGKHLDLPQLLAVKVEYGENAYSFCLQGRVDDEVLQNGNLMIGWAREYLGYMLRVVQNFGGVFSGGSLASSLAMRVLIEAGLVDEIGPEYDILIIPANRDVLRHLAMERREGIVVRTLNSYMASDRDSMFSSGIGGSLKFVLTNLDIFATPAVANALLDLRDHIIHNDFRAHFDHCSAIEAACKKVAVEHPAFGQVVAARVTRPSSW